MISYSETKDLIELVLRVPKNDARKTVHDHLKLLKSSEGEFYDSIIKHAPAMKLTSDQWFDLLSKFPNRILRSQLPVHQILSENQISKLPPISG